MTLLGGFNITVNSFDGIDSLSASNRKFKLKKEFTADQQEKDLEIPATSNIDQIKAYLKTHIPNIADSDLQTIADKIHHQLNPTP